MARKPELGKYLLYRLFSQHKEIRRHLPATARYTPAVLAAFLRRYRVVFVKPSGGSRGQGILKVWRDGGKVHVQHTVHSRRTFRSVEAAVRHVERIRDPKAYVVQQGIPLFQVGGRPVDIRVMVQRERPGGPWLYTGMVAKVAGKDSVVTNVALSRGRVMEVEAALRQGLGWSPQQVQRCVTRLRELALEAARHFDSYQMYRELGFDFGIDTKGRIWLIEENTGPSHLMKLLKNRPDIGRLMDRRWALYQRALRR
ncbi:YheC/YheD family protein [Alicyclobacillus macrosporangiidus]|uniref:YheC/YheD family protein n=1 Tax=Alicyclobacillus macrosporangiidus TaxID=392015 RepID=UPI000691319F|nr:YheC/YheD family protein [Alicyclobacillus macrosporangiidus]